MQISSGVCNQVAPLQPGISTFKKKKPLECWFCGKIGHMKRDCRSLRKQEDGTKGWPAGHEVSQDGKRTHGNDDNEVMITSICLDESTVNKYIDNHTYWL